MAAISCRVQACRGFAKIRLTGASSTTWPFFKIATRSHNDATDARSCEIYRIAMPCSWRSRAKSARISACVMVSSALVDSSASNSAGRCRIASAITNRCAMPTLRLRGYCFKKSRIRRQADAAHQSAAVGFARLVRAPGFFDLRRKPQVRIERRHRTLRHQADQFSADPAQIALFRLQQIRALETGFRRGSARPFGQ